MDTPARVPEPAALVAVVPPSYSHPRYCRHLWPPHVVAEENDDDNDDDAEEGEEEEEEAEEEMEADDEAKLPVAAGSVRDTV